MNIFSGLNKEQIKAAGHINGPILVIAGAGTGKTMVITKRIANLILNKKVDPSNILALTFTDKAAVEMQDRVETLLPYGVVETNVMTFHSLGDEIIREHGLEIGIDIDSQLINGFSQIIFVKQIFEKLKLNYYAPLSNPYKFIDSLINHFSRLKDELVEPEKYLRFAIKMKKDAQSTEEKLEAKKVYELAYAYDTYIKYCIKESKIDHGDQMVLAIKIFKSRPNILAKYQEKFKYILVDEYQDTNFAQNELLNLLCEKHQNVMVVGDDDQSIYRFRGAAINNILQFKQKFTSAKQILLNKNYRSSQAILDIAYKLIQHNNPDRLEVRNNINKRLIGTKKGKTPVFSQYETREEEMLAVASKIKQLIDQGLKAKNIAILVRKNNQLSDIARFLQSNNIAYQLSQNENLFTQPEVLAIINFINCLNNNKDSRSLFGLIASEVFDVKITTITLYNVQAIKSNISLEDYLQSGVDIPENILNVLMLIRELRELMRDFSAGQIIYKFLVMSKYLDKLKIAAKNNSTYGMKIQNIAKFFDLIKEFEMVSHDANIHDFWLYLDQIRKSGVDIMAETSPLDLDMVQILTVHKAKGLEFEAVFMPDMVNQTFPTSRRAELITIPDKLIKISSSKDWHKEEERRLFYVGMTRAKKHLEVSMSFDHGKKNRKKISPFVFEAFGMQNDKKVTNASLPLSKIESHLPSKPIAFDLVKYLYRGEWLHLNVHQVDDYLRNPLDFWYMHVLRVPREPHHSLVYGTAIHQAISAYFHRKLNSKEVKLPDILKVFEQNWVSEGFVSYEHEKQRFKKGRDLLKKFFLSQEKLKKLPIASEQSFKIKLPEIKTTISGRYDAVYQNDTEIEIRDFKTGQKDSLAQASNALKASTQLDIYGLAWERTTGKPPAKLSLHFLENDLLVEKSKIDNNKIFNKIKKVADGIKNKDFKNNGKSYLNDEERI